MKHLLMLIAGARSGAHHAVFHDFAEGLARVMRRRRHWTARVRAVEL
jgi:hypothetical protein